MIQKTLCLVALLLVQTTGIWSAVPRNSSLIQTRVGFSNSEWAKEVSYQVSLRLRSGEEIGRGKGIHCGAALISENVVLTSAYCLTWDNEAHYRKPGEFLVVMGSYYLMDDNENTLDFGVKHFKTGYYNETTHINDIALLFLDGKVPANHPIVKPVTLNEGPLQDGTMCRVFGWGYSPNGSFKDYLLYIDIPLATAKTCRIYSAHGTNIHNSMICAGMNDSGFSRADTCYGDKGGPLECRGLLTGIVSWNNDCGESINPTVLTNVANYKSWIIKHVALRGGAQPSFGKV